MNNALFWITGITLIATAIGGVLAYLGMRSAPEGFEDSEGFHAIITPGNVAPVISTDHAHDDVVSLAA